LDDVIIWATTEDEFVERLRAVLGAFAKRQITVNPDKCRLGLESIEYVGHTIDNEGLSFSKEKIDKVLNTPPPKYVKELMSFLGLASYFREHILNHAMLVKPMQDMLNEQKKTRILTWTEKKKKFK
jgi:hypothetical protein